MAGSILLAAEIGDGHRQADRFLPLARALAAAGRAVTVAMPPDMAARSRIAAAGIAVVDAPAWRGDTPPGFIASCWADLLLTHGYATPTTIEDLLSGWTAALRAMSPVLVVADFAPSAMLAARVAGIAVAPMGDGYTLPPGGMPMPFMRPWAALPTEPLAETEGRVVASLNPVLLDLGAEPVDCVADLLARAGSFLCTFPELDHYDQRADAEYRGEIPPEGEGVAPEWPAGTAERFFVVADGRHRPLPPLLAALVRLGLPALVQAKGISQAEADALRRPGVHVVIEPVDRTAALAQCDVVVCQDNAMAAPALLAGRPLLMIPGPVEQMMTLHRVARQGLGQGLAPDSDVGAADAGVRRLLDSPCRLRAVNFARTYQGYDAAMAVETIVEDCLALAG